MRVFPTDLAGLLLIELDVHEDRRGNFREAFHAARMSEHEELASFVPVQQNVSHSVRGVIRGIHAEPWDKLIHVTYGEVFAAIVDLRPGQPTFGRHQPLSLDTGKALFVPRGLGNGFQALSDVAVYSYLVNAHWDPAARYSAVAYDDPDLGIAWPIMDGSQIVSDKDAQNPSFKDFAERARDERSPAS